MLLNSPIFLIIAGTLSVLGLLLIVQTFRKGLSGFERLALISTGSKNEKGENSLASSQFRSLVLQTIAVPLIACTILVVTFLFQVNSILNLNQWVQHSDNVLLQLNKAHRSVIETESNLRGFRLTNEKLFSDLYLDSQQTAPELLKSLAKMVSDNPRQFKNANEISETFEQWITDAGRTKNEIKKNANLSSLDVVERRKIMASLKNQFENFEKTELAFKAERYETLRRGMNHSLLIIISLALGTGLILSLAGGQQLRKLSANYTGLVENLDKANRDLETKVQDRTLELSATNKELEAFCYSVSHDLRAPLRGIDGFSQILIEEYQAKIDESGVKYLNYIRQGVQKMGVLIDDLLNLSRLTRIEINFKDFDIGQKAENIFLSLRALEPNRQINFKTIKNSMVYADPGLVRIALENLLSNALKYSSKKEVTELEFGRLETSHGLTYFVRDNGVGFDMKYYGKLFNVFQRLHDNVVYKGTGIGLATVKRVILRHGGEIWAESVPEKETTFYFTLKRKA